MGEVGRRYVLPGTATAKDCESFKASARAEEVWTPPDPQHLLSVTVSRSLPLGKAPLTQNAPVFWVDANETTAYSALKLLFFFFPCNLTGLYF